MATKKVDMEVTKGKELKHLEFVRFAAIQAMVCVSSLYKYAKQNSGPLRSTVGSVEGAVATVVGPVYEKFKSVPGDLLVFVDKKVDEAAHKFDEHAPPLAKRVVRQTQYLLEKASEKAQKLVHEVQVGGPRAGLHYAASEYKQGVITVLAKTCVEADHIPPFHVVAEMVVPTAAYCSEKYNCIVTDLSGKGYTIFTYLPLVPIDEMAKTYKQEKARKEGAKDDSGAQDTTSSDSD